MTSDDYSNNINTFNHSPNEEKPTWFSLPRYVIEYCCISPETKGYYAMYMAEVIEWEDIPFQNREDLYSIPNFEDEEVQ